MSENTRVKDSSATYLLQVPSMHGLGRVRDHLYQQEMLKKVKTNVKLNVSLGKRGERDHKKGLQNKILQDLIPRVQSLDSRTTPTLLQVFQTEG